MYQIHQWLRLSVINWHLSFFRLVVISQRVVVVFDFREKIGKYRMSRMNSGILDINPRHSFSTFDAFSTPLFFGNRTLVTFLALFRLTTY